MKIAEPCLVYRKAYISFSYYYILYNLYNWALRLLL